VAPHRSRLPAFDPSTGSERAFGSRKSKSTELRAEFQSLDRAVEEIALVAPGEGSGAPERVRIYAAAALLDTFYSAVERALERIARTFGAVPSGPRRHVELLAASALDIPGLRPAVLSGDTQTELRRFLAFRHRFRNLYLFDLDAEQIAPLAGCAGATWRAARSDFERFADALDGVAASLEQA